MATKRNASQAAKRERPPATEEPESKDGSTETLTRAERAAAARSAARAILDDFIGAVEQCSANTWPGQIDYANARYLADAFLAILGGKDANLALGIKTSNEGRRKGSRKHDHRAIAAALELLRRAGLPEVAARKALARERLTKAAAHEGQTAKPNTAASAKTVSDAAKKYSYYEYLPGDVLTKLATIHAELIEKIIAARKAI